MALMQQLLSLWRRPKRARAAAAQQSRGHMGAFRAYNAADLNRLTSSWSTQPLSPEEVIRRDLRTLRARSREQSRNNEYARAYLQMVATNVVGPRGIILQSRVQDPDERPDDIASAAIESAWEEWSQPQYCDVARRLSWLDHQNLFAQTVARDGEYLARKAYGSQFGPYGFALQPLDTELLDVGYDRKAQAEGLYIRAGIEYDAWGVPVAYYLFEPGSSTYGSYYFGAKRRRFAADQILHAFVPEEVGQRRGIPWMATALMELRMLGLYREAALVAAQVGAAKMGFFRNVTPEGYAGEGKDSAGDVRMSAEPGEFDWLPKGAELHSWDPEYPRGEFPDFVKSSLRGIAAGLGVSYNGLSRDLEGVNFSSIRSGVLDEREQWKGRQEWMIGSFCRPTFDAFLEAAVLAGAIEIAGKPLTYDRLWKYRRAAWQARRWSWVDPQADVTANIMAIENGLRSRSDVIREAGGEPDEVWMEIAAEQKRMETLGVKVAPPGTSTVALKSGAGGAGNAQ